MIGYEYLPGMDKKTAKIASQAIVFMFSALNDNIKIPLSYYFIHSMEGEDKYRLMSEIAKAAPRSWSYYNQFHIRWP